MHAHVHVLVVWKKVDKACQNHLVLTQGTIGTSGTIDFRYYRLQVLY